MGGPSGSGKGLYSMGQGGVLGFPVAELRVGGQWSQSGNVGVREKGIQNLTLGFLQVRDDNKRLHPCLVNFHSLPEPERNYNLQMSGETLK